MITIAKNVESFKKTLLTRMYLRNLEMREFRLPFKGKIMSNILSDLKTAGTNFLHPDDFENYSVVFRKPLWVTTEIFVCAHGPA